jgi:hypothetical protein
VEVDAELDRGQLGDADGAAELLATADSCETETRGA